MGLFYFMNKEKNNNTKSVAKGFAQESSKEDMQVKQIDDGKRVQVEFYDPQVKFGQFYDTTRLILDNQKYKLGNSIVSNCLISWYSQDDAVLINAQNPRDMYERIFASLDTNRMIQDREYCAFAMKQLLNRKRVEEYLNRGKTQEEPQVPCGDYIGGIEQKDNGKLEKVFDCKAGKQRHYSADMLQARKETAKIKEKQTALRREELKRKIQEEQDELDRL